METFLNKRNQSENMLSIKIPVLTSTSQVFAQQNIIKPKHFTTLHEDKINKN